MRDRSDMSGVIRAVCAAAMAVVAFSATGAAAPKPNSAPLVATDLSAQSRAKKRPQIRVTPRYPYRRFHSLYPLPYDIEYPGPNAKRECVAKLVQEARPSGTVLVPRMRCWWVRG